MCYTNISAVKEKEGVILQMLGSKSESRGCTSAWRGNQVSGPSYHVFQSKVGGWGEEGKKKRLLMFMAVAFHDGRAMLSC